MTREELILAGFVENAVDGRSFQCDPRGRVIAFGFQIRDQDGGLRARWVEIEPDRGAALTSITRAHPFRESDGEHDESLEIHLAQALKDMQEAHLNQPRCAFCEKRDTEVARLIAGPAVMICNECVALCQEILGS